MNVPADWISIAGALKSVAVLANMPGIVTSVLVLGDELDERFGPVWSVV